MTTTLDELVEVTARTYEDRVELHKTRIREIFTDEPWPGGKGEAKDVKAQRSAKRKAKQCKLWTRKTG